MADELHFPCSSKRLVVILVILMPYGIQPTQRIHLVNSCYLNIELGEPASFKQICTGTLNTDRQRIDVLEEFQGDRPSSLNLE